MENPEACRARAAQDRELAERPDTTSRMRDVLLTSARRWDSMADAGADYEEERSRREANVKKMPPKRTAKTRLLVLTREMMV